MQQQSIHNPYLYGNTINTLSVEEKKTCCVYFHFKKNSKEFIHNPFYVGISDNIKRPYSNRNRTQHWHNIVNKHGYYVIIVHDNITWESACKHEKIYIQALGRIDKGNGCLINLTDGGEGSVGYKHSEEELKKMSIGSRSFYKTPDIRAAHGNKIKEALKDPVKKANADAARKETNNDPAIREKQSAATKKRYENPEERIKKGEETKNVWASYTDEEKTLRVSNMQVGMLEASANRTPEKRKINSEINSKAQLKRLADMTPEERAAEKKINTEKQKAIYVALPEEVKLARKEQLAKARANKKPINRTPEEQAEWTRKISETKLKAAAIKKAERHANGIYTKQELKQMAFAALSEEEKEKRRKNAANFTKNKKTNK